MTRKEKKKQFPESQHDPQRDPHERQLNTEPDFHPVSQRWCVCCHRSDGLN